MLKKYLSCCIATLIAVAITMFVGHNFDLLNYLIASGVVILFFSALYAVIFTIKKWNSQNHS